MSDDGLEPKDWEKKQMAAILGVLDGMDLNEEGAELFNKGDYAGAAAKYREALEGNLFGVGEKHVSTALCFGNLGKSLRFMGRLDEAEYNLKKAIAVSSNPDYREDLAKVYEMKGDSALAGDTRRGGDPGYMACGNYNCPSQPFRSISDLSRCSTCKNIYYCAKPCQTDDWKRHKPYCKSTGA